MPESEPCQLCGSREKKLTVLDLGFQPICNAFLQPRALNEHEPLYSLKVVVCEECFLVQLADKLPREVVFGKNYNYLSGTTGPLLTYFEALVDQILQTDHSDGKVQVCDIGSNDGSLLKFFKALGCGVLGVEPTPFPASHAISNGIPTVQDYMTKGTGRKVADSHGKMDIVTALNVLAHADDVHSLMSGVEALLTEKGLFVNQSHYLPSLFDKLEYDTIYHEHLRYYTLNALSKLHEMHGLHIFDAQLTDFYGGSVLVFSSFRRRQPSTRFTQILESEKKYQSLGTYIEFRSKVEENAKKLRSTLLELKENGKRIVGVGAPMKSSTLLNFCGLGPDVIDCLTEVNPLKIGTFSPGVHIPVVAEEEVFRTQPDYALILSWNVADAIVEKLRAGGYRGGFIIPIPEPHTL